MSAPTNVLATLGDDVAAVLEGLGLRATAATRITGLPSRRSDRATFRVVLEDGRLVKARRLMRAEKAVRFTRIVHHLADAPLSAVLAVDGRVVVEEWIDGTPLTALPLSAERLGRAAAVLGALHATHPDDGAPAHARGATKGPQRQARRHLGQLAAAGALDRSELHALVDAVERCAPAEATRGLTHNDFCAANIVEDPLGRLVIVDNEGLRDGFLGFDLARTWYRWPMPPAAWTTFLDRYAQWRDPADDLHSAPFWRIAAVARSARLRLARESPRATVPIARLRALATEHSRARPGHA